MAADEAVEAESTEPAASFARRVSIYLLTMGYIAMLKVEPNPGHNCLRQPSPLPE